jgi:hypothetical protein
MARRPRSPDDVLSRTELAELQRRLSMMGQTAVQDFYRTAHMVCRIGPGHFPSARAIQELVQAWKQMRKWLTPSRASFFPSGAAGSKHLLVTPVTVRNVTSRQFAGLLLT